MERIVSVELPVPPWVVGVAVLAGLVGFGVSRAYQRCPHCGRPARRVCVGWLRCKHCGRQYRKGLRLR